MTLMYSAQTNQTAQGLIARSNPPKRPFVLTRSFYAGSQRFGAMWTGDNLGTWEHMAVGNKMVLANNIAGMTFAGCTSSFAYLFEIRHLTDRYSRRRRVLRQPGT
jgi:alpha-glucosidase (family GH31 glycosyl hydrolase)